ncbi:hypothetical protein FPV67DRAFT_1452672 [Lyophyllum atratum]|nr:hypothetical protein FPV67DRAFT_1452672 [Lyophyllum atratum]
MVEKAPREQGDRIRRAHCMVKGPANQQLVTQIVVHSRQGPASQQLVTQIVAARSVRGRECVKTGCIWSRAVVDDGVDSVYHFRSSGRAMLPLLGTSAAQEVSPTTVSQGQRLGSVEGQQEYIRRVDDEKLTIFVFDDGGKRYVGDSSGGVVYIMHQHCNTEIGSRPVFIPTSLQDTSRGGKVFLKWRETVLEYIHVLHRANPHRNYPFSIAHRGLETSHIMKQLLQQTPSTKGRREF